MTESRQLLVLIGSPRRAGNSATVAAAVERGASDAGIVHQFQEYACDPHSAFGGVVRGVGNWRREITRDSGAPDLAAEQLGREIFARKYSDDHLDTARRGRVWPDDSQAT